MHTTQSCTHDNLICNSGHQPDIARKTVLRNEKDVEAEDVSGLDPIVEFVQPARKPNMAAQGCLTAVKVIGKVIGCMNRKVSNGYAVTPT